MVITSRRVGNSIVLTIPSEMHISEGAKFEPVLSDEGITYKFVAMEQDTDFDGEILRELMKEGYTGEALIKAFEERKQEVPLLFQKLTEEASKAPILTREEFEKEIGL